MSNGIVNGFEIRDELYALGIVHIVFRSVSLRSIFKLPREEACKILEFFRGKLRTTTITIKDADSEYVIDEYSHWGCAYMIADTKYGVVRWKPISLTRDMAMRLADQLDNILYGNKHTTIKQEGQCETLDTDENMRKQMDDNLRKVFE